MTPEHVKGWVERHPLTPIHVDCATAVMLKVLDGKCRMSEEEMRVMTLLYDAVKERPGALLDGDMHALITAARESADEEMRNHIYEKRVLAESTLSRLMMKSFKTMLRQTGLFDAPPGTVGARRAGAA